MAIDLKKGQKINLQKENGEGLKEFFVGVNWGKVIEKHEVGFIRKMFGQTEVVKKQDVDLDLAAFLLDKNMKTLEVVYYKNLETNGIKHSGDDLTGDDENDDNDNETIIINTDKINENVRYIIFTLNSFNGVKFDKIPYAKIRLCEGKPDNIKNIFATFKIENDEKFQNKLSMILGELIKEEGGWHFKSIGIPTEERYLADLGNYINKNKQIL